MQQDFCNQQDLRPECYQAGVYSSYPEVNYEVNQNIRIEQNLSEMKYEANSDSQKYKETAKREFEKTNYRSRRYKEGKNICSYKRKSKLDNHAYQEKVYNGKLNVYEDKDKTNYKRRKKRGTLQY